jgi:hypothetical protein
MLRTFSRRLDNQDCRTSHHWPAPSGRRGSFAGTGGCATCAAAASNSNGGIAGYGVGALSDDDKRTYLTYGAAASVLVGGVGFAMGSPIAIGIGLVGLFGSMAGLAMVPADTANDGSQTKTCPAGWFPHPDTGECIEALN